MNKNNTHPDLFKVIFVAKVKNKLLRNTIFWTGLFTFREFSIKIRQFRSDSSRVKSLSSDMRAGWFHFMIPENRYFLTLLDLWDNYFHPKWKSLFHSFQLKSEKIDFAASRESSRFFCVEYWETLWRMVRSRIFLTASSATMIFNQSMENGHVLVGDHRTRTMERYKQSLLRTTKWKQHIMDILFILEERIPRRSFLRCLL